MNELQAKITRNLQLEQVVNNLNPHSARHKNDSSKSPKEIVKMAQKISRYKPRNLDDVASACDISPSNAPAMIHNKSPMTRVKL